MQALFEPFSSVGAPAGQCARQCGYCQVEPTSTTTTKTMTPGKEAVQISGNLLLNLKTARDIESLKPQIIEGLARSLGSIQTDWVTIVGVSKVGGRRLMEATAWRVDFTVRLPAESAGLAEKVVTAMSSNTTDFTGSINEAFDKAGRSDMGGGNMGGRGRCWWSGPVSETSPMGMRTSPRPAEGGTPGRG